MQNLVVFLCLNMLQNTDIETDKCPFAADGSPLAVLLHPDIFGQPLNLCSVRIAVKHRDIKILPVLLSKIVEEGLDASDRVQILVVEDIDIHHSLPFIIKSYRLPSLGKL